MQMALEWKCWGGVQKCKVMSTTQRWCPPKQIIRLSGQLGGPFQNFWYGPHRTWVEHVHPWLEVGLTGTLRSE